MHHCEQAIPYFEPRLVEGIVDEGHQEVVGHCKPHEGDEEADVWVVRCLQSGPRVISILSVSIKTHISP